VQLLSPAKINLGLRVYPRLADGFHPIETLFFKISIADQIEIREAANFKISCTAPEVPLDEKNLVWKVYQLATELGTIPPCHIHLKKSIPCGAGLGGGSSNATEVFKHLKKRYCLDINPLQSVDYLKEIGSDLPFFLENKPCFGSGRGERLEPINKLPTLKLCLVLPKFGMSTPRGYQLWDQNHRFHAPAPYPLRSVITDLHDTGGQNLPNLICNDLQKPLEEELPEFVAIRKALEKSGAIYTSLTGSGSAFYGIYLNPEDQDDAFRKLKQQFKTVLKAHTI